MDYVGDANVEHLLDVFTSVLGPKVEGLPDDHPPKPTCLLRLSELLERVANHTEEKRLLTLTLQLERQRGDDSRVAHTLYL